MTTQRTSPEGLQAEMPWPLRFDSFSFGTRAFNTLRCNIIFRGHQFALDDELDGPSGPPPSPDWKDRWTASFIVANWMMPPGPVEIRWTSLDGVEHYVEIDLIKDIFPDLAVLHNVPKEDVNEAWARYDKDTPDVLMEINDRTINVYMSAMVLTKSPPNPARPDVLFRNDLVLAWTKNY